jgi:Protein of unknown function, DUF255
MRSAAGVSSVCLALIAACARPPATAGAPATPRAAGAETADAARPPAAGSLSWAELDAATFARARAEGRIVLIDGTAGWCHWCHVMDATTYRDPQVRKLLAERFLPVRVDIDARPDFEERYQEWGWPATVLMTADAEEIGKYKGYMAPARLLEVLNAAVSSRTPAPGAPGGKATATGYPAGASAIASAAASPAPASAGPASPASVEPDGPASDPASIAGGPASLGGGYGDQQKLPGVGKSDRQMNGAVQSELDAHFLMHSFDSAAVLSAATQPNPLGQSASVVQSWVQ